MNTSLLRPRTASDPTLTNPFAQGGLLDQMFDASFPWKLLKAFAPDAQRPYTQDFLPSMDLSSDAKAYTLQAELPGMPKDQVKLEIHDGVLTLSGEKKEERTEGEAKERHVVERRFGSFSRSLTLPEDADQEHITASHKDGVLTITIPRITPVEHKKVISIAG